MKSSGNWQTKLWQSNSLQNSVWGHTSMKLGEIRSFVLSASNFERTSIDRRKELNLTPSGWHYNKIRLTRMQLSVFVGTRWSRTIIKQLFQWPFDSISIQLEQTWKRRGFLLHDSLFFWMIDWSLFFTTLSATGVAGHCALWLFDIYWDMIPQGVPTYYCLLE